ncbi:MAG TPA: hypothetical protein VFY54_09875 [Rubrobacter sp.]|nr:hypothetical protein [Rubrobacter sp.]
MATKGGQNAAPATTLEGQRSPCSATRIWLWLTGPIAFLVTIAAGVGFFIDGVYRDAPVNAAQAVGQDLITLLVALPVLVVSAILALRGSMRAHLVWLGALGYLVYTYASFALAIEFNSLFLVYVALLGLSLYTLIGGLATTEFAGMKAHFSRGTPVKAVGIFLAVVAVLFYFMWLSEDIPALLAGEVPQGVIEAEAPTDVVHVLDMALLLPANVLTAIWLWRRRALGYVLAGTLLSFLSLVVLAVMSMMVFQVLYGVAAVVEALGIAVVFGVVFAVSVGMLVWHLSALEE